MAEIRRSNLDWARDVARAYRAALRVVDPEKCKELDRLARRHKQLWIAPTFVPPAVADHTEDAVLAAKDIERGWGVPAHSIWGWSAKGLLVNHGRKQRPKFRVSEVLEVEGRHRKVA